MPHLVAGRRNFQPGRASQRIDELLACVASRDFEAVECGGSESAPMCSRIRLICVPSVMKAIRRFCPPHSGHSSRDQENNSSLPSKDMRPSCAPKAGNFSFSWRRNSISDCLWVSVSTAGVATMASP